MTRTKTAHARFAAALLTTAFLLTGCTPADPLTGSWTGPVPSGTGWIEFASDGTFTSYDGCNGAEGVYTSAEGVTALTFTGGTEAACVEQPWLQDAVTVVLSGENLVFRDDVDTELGTFTRGAH